ncbi:hypothetical protein Syn7502_00012 [Synechococcus sp. PCC 7502]|uniref:Tic20 family protein n=1 Tax=Synechococcus sp. PCC 7502 TaxID=1173263 RepID=UPI00029FC8AC|nr:Tic20 family protein [Synechococcus sp. PCC 7502]AFY72187.1 hypothetical protein Syn7502_00012 [Synechococcus sp. PCC 7502]
MTIRGSATLTDKLWGSLLYALPMASVVIPYGLPIFNQVPYIVYPFLPFIALLGVLNIQIIPQLISVDVLVFLCLYFFVVRNIKISHFIRFNAMQSILLRIILILIQVISSLLAPVIGSLGAMQFLVEVFANTIFMGMTAACVYAVVQTIRGAYAEMPIVSDAAYYQVPY